MTEREAKRARMVRLVERFEGSGLTAAAFCRRHRLRPQQLSYWRRALVRRRSSSESPARRRTASAVRFTPVRLVGSERDALGPGVEVSLPGGERLVVRPGTPMELVRSVLEALRGRC